MWKELMGEWIDIPKIKQVCHHTSTFAIGVIVWALAKPATVAAQWIGTKCHEPIPLWLIQYCSFFEDVLLAYFIAGLGIRLAIELWPFHEKRQRPVNPAIPAVAISNVAISTETASN